MSTITKFVQPAELFFPPTEKKRRHLRMARRSTCSRRSTRRSRFYLLRSESRLDSQVKGDGEESSNGAPRLARAIFRSAPWRPLQCSETVT
jgi:hypothetical protein